MKIEDIQNSAEKVISQITKGDVTGSFSEASPVEFEMDRLKSIEDISRFAMGLRVLEGGRVGNSYINSLNDIPELIKNAKESASLGDTIDYDLPGKTNYPDLPLYNPEVLTLTKEQAVTLGEKLLSDLKQIDKKAQASVTVSKSSSIQFLGNTSGFAGQYKETRFHVSGGLVLVEDDGSLLHVGDGDSSYDLKIDREEILKKVEWRYKNAQKKVSVKTGYLPVIFTPDSLDLLLETLEIAANGKTLYKGISVLADKLDQKITSENFSLLDDPFYPGATGCYPFDDEGVVPKPMPIIENGVFKNYIYDIATAKRLSKKSTGHGSRSAASLPAPSFSNLIIPAGKTPLSDMIASIDYGILVFEFLGGGMSNVLAGDFSVNIELGYLIEKGKIKGRVKDAMMTGNAFELLKDIGALEDKVHKNGGLFAPHILFNRVSVAG